MIECDFGRYGLILEDVIYLITHPEPGWVFPAVDEERPRQDEHPDDLELN